MIGLLFLNGEPPKADTLAAIDYQNSFVVCADGAYDYLKDYCVPDVFVGDFDSVSANLDDTVERCETCDCQTRHCNSDKLAKEFCSVADEGADCKAGRVRAKAAMFADEFNSVPAAATEVADETAGKVRAKTVIRLPVDKDYTDGHVAMQHLIAKKPDKILIYGATGKAADHELSNYSLLYLAMLCGISAAIKGEMFTIYLAAGDSRNSTEAHPCTNDLNANAAGFSTEDLVSDTATNGLETNTADFFTGDFVSGTATTGLATETLLPNNTAAGADSGKFAAKARVGARVSVVPFSDSVHIIRTTGLKFEIRDETYGKLHIKGISNAAIAEQIGIEIASGAALIFVEN